MYSQHSVAAANVTCQLTSNANRQTPFHPSVQGARRILHRLPSQYSTAWQVIHTFLQRNMIEERQLLQNGAPVQTMLMKKLEILRVREIRCQCIMTSEQQLLLNGTAVQIMLMKILGILRVKRSSWQCRSLTGGWQISHSMDSARVMTPGIDQKVVKCVNRSALRRHCWVRTSRKVCWAISQLPEGSHSICQGIPKIMALYTVLRGIPSSYRGIPMATKLVLNFKHSVSPLSRQQGWAKQPQEGCPSHP